MKSKVKNASRQKISKRTFKRSFMNKFTLPPHAIVEEISANVKNGVLKIVVPKASAAAQTVKRIPVDVA